MGNRGICAICKKNESKFKTRCGHVFHKACLKKYIYDVEKKRCASCKCKVSLSKTFEKLIWNKCDFSKIPIRRVTIKVLERLMKYGLNTKSLPCESILQKMVDLGWEVDKLDDWCGLYRNMPLFYCAYISGNLSLANKLIELGCKLVRVNPFNESVLPRAVEDNNIEFVNKLISVGIDVNVVDRNESALEVACRNDNLEMAELLLENGATLSRREFNHFNSETALVLACRKGSFRIIKSIHKYCPDHFKDDSIIWDAFIAAINQENIQLIDLLIESGGNINTVKPDIGRNILMQACAHGNMEIIEHVYSKGDFDVNAVDSSGNSAILCSCKVEVIKFLIEKGADLLAKNTKDNYTILHKACKYKYYELIKYLLNETAFSNIGLLNLSSATMGLIEIALNFNGSWGMEIVNLLIQKGADINERNMKNETAFLNSYTRQYEIVKFLISHGADVNVVDADGLNCFRRYLNTKMGKKVNSKIVEFLKLFVESGTDLNSRDKFGKTVMHNLCINYSNSRVDFIEYFLDSGARTDIPDNNGEFPFDMACLWKPFGHLTRMLEKRGLNDGKYITAEVRSKPCDQCNGVFPSLFTRCGHYIHLSCMKVEFKCHLCDTTVSESNRVEKFIRERNFAADLQEWTSNEVLILVFNYNEVDSIIDLETLTSEMERHQICKEFLLKAHTHMSHDDEM